MIERTNTELFWKWFKENCDKLHSNMYPNDTFIELDRRIVDFGLCWEVGPGISKKNLLIISTNGRRELLESARNFIFNASELENWEIEILKKPKTNWHKLEIPKDNIKISAIDWTYVLLKYKDGKKEILIKGDSLAPFDKDTKIELAEIVLTNLLGEEKSMNELDFLDVLEVHDTTYKMGPMKDLSNHLDSLRTT